MSNPSPQDSIHTAFHEWFSSLSAGEEQSMYHDCCKEKKIRKASRAQFVAWIKNYFISEILPELSE